MRASAGRRSRPRHPPPRERNGVDGVVIVNRLLYGVAHVLSPSRAVCLRSSAMPNTKTIQDVTRNTAAAMSVSEDQAAQFLANSTMLHVSPTAADTAKVAAFLASDSARTITGTQVMSEIR